jgi:hypothetical protein
MEDLISEQIVLEQIKKAISEQMGRIILRWKCYFNQQMINSIAKNCLSTK